jgi:predicted small metal-binding protein
MPPWLLLLLGVILLGITTRARHPGPGAADCTPGARTFARVPDGQARPAALPWIVGRKPLPAGKEGVMTRKYVDCREMPSESRCTIAISADDETELLEAAIQHAIAVHGHRDSVETRAMLKQAMHQGSTV